MSEKTVAVPAQPASTKCVRFCDICIGTARCAGRRCAACKRDLCVQHGLINPHDEMLGFTPRYCRFCMPICAPFWDELAELRATHDKVETAVEERMRAACLEARKGEE